MDGSEIRSVELERLTAEGISHIERRNAFEFMRDEAAALFLLHTGSAWTPRAGSKVNHRALTSAVIDSRDFIAAKRRAEAEVLVPAGTRIGFAGGMECNDTTAIWQACGPARQQPRGAAMGGLNQGTDGEHHALGAGHWAVATPLRQDNLQGATAQSCRDR